MGSVAGYSVKLVWMKMVKINLVPIAGWKIQYIWKILRVSESEDIQLTNLTHLIIGKREIKALRVKCDNVEEGCGWTGNLGTLRTHLKACECIVVSCKYGSIGCDMKMIRKDMEAHEQDDKAHLHQALDTVVKLQTSLMTVGSLKFKITEYGKKREENMHFKSKSFYTHAYGYNAGIEVYLNGNDNGRNTHLSVFFRIIKGDYDVNLKWPFTGTVKIVLLNQLTDSNHYLYTMSFNKEDNVCINSSWGYTQFISHLKLNFIDPYLKIQYLKDDTLYFRVTVEVSDHKPWLE